MYQQRLQAALATEHRRRKALFGAQVPVHSLKAIGQSSRHGNFILAVNRLREKTTQVKQGIQSLTQDED